MLRARPRQYKNREVKREAELLSSALPPLLLQAEQLVRNINPGIHGRRKAGSGEDFWQFRPYGQQDPSSDIDWRQSAKRDQLYIRQKELETAESVWFWLDTGPNMMFRSEVATSSKKTEAQILTLATALLLMQGGENFGLAGASARASHGTVAFDRFAHFVTDQNGFDLEAFSKRHAASGRSRYVLISDFLYPPEDIESTLKKLSGAGGTGFLLHMADPAEVSLPYSGRTRFEGMKDDLSLTLGKVEAYRDDYQKRFSEHREFLKGLSKSLSWAYHFHSTDQPAGNALSALYTTLQGGNG